MKCCVDLKVCDQQQLLSPSPWSAKETDDAVRVIQYPFQDQIPADIVKKQLNDLSFKVHITIQPDRKLNVKETKPPMINQQCVVYSFLCDLCDAGYAGYKHGRLLNRVKGHKQQSSAIAKDYKTVHETMPQGLLKHLKCLRNAKPNLAVWCTKCFS